MYFLIIDISFLYIGLFALDENVLEDIYNNMADLSKHSEQNEESLVNFQSFLHFTDTPNTLFPFAQKVFHTIGWKEYQLFDLDIFMTGLWRVCTVDDEVELGLLLFKLYQEEADEDHKDLSVETIKCLITDLHGDENAVNVIK